MEGNTGCLFKGRCYFAGELENQQSCISTSPVAQRSDELEEARLADKQYGSTKQGIAPFYSDKYLKKTILAGELFYPKELKARLQVLLEWKNLTLTRIYGAKPYTMELLEYWLYDFCEPIKPFLCDTGAYLKEAQQNHQSILFEAQLRCAVIWTLAYIPTQLLPTL